MIQERIIMVGAGGHAKVVIDLLRAMGKQVDYCIGNFESPKFCLEVPVLEGDEKLLYLRNQGYSKAFIAIGCNMLRQQMANMVLNMGYDLVNAISPNAMISPSVRIGNGVAVMTGAIINAASDIQDLTIVNTGATIDHDCKIGIGAHIGPQCALAGNVTVGNLSFLGVGSKVIPGIQIGPESILGAGSVVTRNIPGRVTAVGIPAKIIKNH